MTHVKKRETIRRVVVYTIMVTAILSLTTILLLLMLGYRYNKGDNNFVQGGLVQFNSQPTGASVRVGTADLASRTRSKITLNPGEYKVRMTLAGYRDWEKTATVYSGTVLWLNYAQFVPTDPQTNSVFETPKLASVAMQEQGRRIALLQDAAVPTITTVVANDDQVAPKSLSLPTASFAASNTHAFSLEKLSGDNKHLLVKHQYDAGVEWLIVDLDDATKSYAISSDVANQIASVQFDPSAEDAAYALFVDGSVRKVSLGNGEQSEVLLRNVADFTLTSSGSLFYTTRPSAGAVSTGYLTKNKTESRTIDTFQSDESIHIAAGKYFNTFYVATSLGSNTTIKAYDTFPESDSETALVAKSQKNVTTKSPVTLLSFKADARLVAIQQARSLTVYDVDLAKQSDIALKGVTQDISKPIEWLNAFHFWNDASGSARQYEFDGANQEDITKVASGFSAAYSQNKRYFYTIGKTEQGFSLQRTRMVL
jgi:hypothetical protein